MPTLAFLHQCVWYPPSVYIKGNKKSCMMDTFCAATGSCVTINGLIAAFVYSCQKSKALGNFRNKLAGTR